MKMTTRVAQEAVGDVFDLYKTLPSFDSQRALQSNGGLLDVPSSESGIELGSRDSDALPTLEDLQAALRDQNRLSHALLEALGKCVIAIAELDTDGRRQSFTR